MFLSGISRIIGIPEITRPKNYSLIKEVLGKLSTILPTWKVVGILTRVKKNGKTKIIFNWGIVKYIQEQ